MASSVTRGLFSALKKHLKTAMPELKEVYDDFPLATETLQYPSMSVFTGQPRFMNGLPYAHTRTRVDAEDDENPAVNVVNIIGQYEFRLQLDLWCKTKFERHDLYEKLFRALNPDTATSGLSLQLTEYYDLWARFLVNDFQLMAGEAETQRNEFRVKVGVVADVKAVTESVESAILEIENNMETPSASEEIEEDEESEEDSYLASVF
jgi:hypothetical protein